MAIEKIVRALDVGYGNVKFVRRHDSMEESVVCDMFPSSAPVAGDKLAGEGIGVRNTVDVKVGGNTYEVGHDVAQAKGASDISTNFNDKYVRSDKYKALVLGALHYMFLSIEQNHIDLLVVGLPVDKMKDHKEYLIELLKTTHELPNERVVEIKDVKVFAQPLGAFFNFMYSPDEKDNLSFHQVKSQRNLVIDPGMFTFDWLLIENMKGVDEQSGSSEQSMSRIITALSKKISADNNNANKETVFQILDNAFRKGTTPRVFSKDIDLDKYMQFADPVINQSVDLLVRSVNDGANIDNIMLVGGGARFFLKAIKKKFPHHNIMTTSNSVYANVIGFQMGGERAMLQQQVAARKTTISA